MLPTFDISVLNGIGAFKCFLLEALLPFAPAGRRTFFWAMFEDAVALVPLGVMRLLRLFLLLFADEATFFETVVEVVDVLGVVFTLLFVFNEGVDGTERFAFF